MQTPYNSSEILSENHFANINRYSRYNPQNKEERNSFKRTQTLSRNPSEYNSIQATSKNDRNPRQSRAREKEHKKRRQRVITDSPSNSTSKQTRDNVAKRIYLWCAQCCRRKKSKIAEVRKSQSNFFKRLRVKCKKRKKKKKASFSRDVTQREDVVGVASTESKDLKKRRRRKKKEKTDVAEPSAHSFQTDEDEEAVEGVVPDLGIDFTKSCCYLCAKNTMAIAAAMSNKMERYHISVQASTKELFTSDKSCSPSMHVRTVQSSVKVKMRDMSTLYPEKKKSNKAKAKQKLKNILPKLKLPTHPKVRTVACETDKSMRHKNIPQCRARRGAHCVTEADVKP